MTRILGLVVIAALAGCGHNNRVVIYRSLSQPGAMQTCDANKRYHFEVKGADAEDAKRKAAEQIRSTVTTSGGCGGYVYDERSGKALDGSTIDAGNYQWCSCSS